ncbi:hypothetical protein [Paraflavitalea sp. CAU 1676]|uniref:hypothetical protein n=1 Tax=Paraflavitalea sp. CAU 1676 TaxID=3032598 RepID=UPI0023DC94B3|nr:hypothetical protein [Paraflavitalea sp. CAU 1676]MDF2188953.1 hypothetical protein [Paraflavitalea sp. CAU 1676]
MINPQENPHLLTQDYFQELLEKIFPGMKVNDIIPFHHQGLASAMINNRSIYYGYWTFPCSSYNTELSHIKCAGSPDKIVLGPFPNGGVTAGLAFDYSWFGLASYVQHSATFNSFSMTFSGFRATFDNTPAPPPAPIPEPITTEYEYTSQPPGVFEEGMLKYQFQVQGVPNSTLHMNLDGTSYFGNDIGSWSVRYQGGGDMFPPIALSQFNTSPVVGYDVELNSSGLANMELRFFPYPGFGFAGVYGNIVSATAGVPGSPLITFEYGNI